MVSHLIEKLPGSVGDKAPPADVIVNIIAVLNNLVVESPMAARDIVYFDGLRKLFYVKKRRDRWELACLFLHPNHGVAHHRSHLFSIWVLLTTPTRSTLASALGLCGVVSLGWWVPSHTLWYPKHDCIFSPYSSSDNEKSSRAAASLLGNMWQYTKLHRDFKVVRTSLWGGRAYGRAQGSHGWGLHPGKCSTQMLPGV